MIAAWEHNHTNLLIDRVQQAMTEPRKKVARELGEKALHASSAGGVALAADKIEELLLNLRKRREADRNDSRDTEL